MRYKKFKKKISSTYVIVANTPTYYKLINREEGTLAIHSSNLDIGIRSSPNTTAHITDKDWGAVTDHRPILFTLKAKLRLKDRKKRKSKPKFFVPKAVERAKLVYNGGEKQLMLELECIYQNDPTTAQKFFKTL